ncbi:NAD(P)/FAD-dependent oxidoreductase [Naumannella halotolerans]|uniref:NAD(P)/FAD-dependent oxidoreductase n=1 Tax=Naumannella halotolerans TaxID=993414 RepID=UPI00370D9E70
MTQPYPARQQPGWDIAPIARDWAGLPAVGGDLAADACVVGLGGSGLAAVEELLDRGLSVIGVDAGRVAAGAAGRNGGFLIGGPAMPLSTPTPNWTDQAKADLWSVTLAELDHLSTLLGPRIVHRCPWLNIAGPIADTDPDAGQAELAALQTESAALRAIGLQVDPWTGPLGNGIAIAGQARVNPAERVLTTAAALIERGAELYEHSPVSRTADGVVSTPSGTITAKIIIVAVDGRLDQLFPQLPVTTYRLQMLSTGPLGRRVLPDAVVSAREGYEWLQQDDAGRLLLGGGRDHQLVAERTANAEPSAEVQQWIEGVAAAVIGGPFEVTHRWAASVGYTEDERPLCVPIDQTVMAVGGYSGHGNLVGAVNARAAVRHLLDGASVPDWANSTPA